MSPAVAGRDIDVLVIGAAAPDAKECSLVTFLAGNRLGHLAAPLLVVPANPSDEQIGKIT